MCFDDNDLTCARDSRVVFTKEKDGIDVLVRRSKYNGASKVALVVNGIKQASMYVQERTVVLEDGGDTGCLLGDAKHYVVGCGWDDNSQVSIGNAAECVCGKEYYPTQKNIKQSGNDGKADATCPDCGMITHYVFKDFWRKKLEVEAVDVVVGTGCYNCATKCKCCCHK